jgi:hypothetical protein
MVQIKLQNLQSFRQQRWSMHFLFLVVPSLFGVIHRVDGLVVPAKNIQRLQRHVSHSLHISVESCSLSCVESSRRKFLFKYLTTFAKVALPLILPDGVSAKEPVGDIIWMTGKMPQVPGQKPRDKNDLTGTRKDPSFLRSLADCKNQCENTASTGGYSKTKDECLSECQDICCTSYQQCTFAIVQRI